MTSNRFEIIKSIRSNLSKGHVSIGTWQQIPHPSISEILGNAGFDWVAVDLEHGSISTHQLPDLFRAIELGGSLPLARIAQAAEKDCRQALDAGAGGLIIPMVSNAQQLEEIVSVCQWPPAGSRGVGFCRANLYGKYFEGYIEEAQNPLIIAQIENRVAVENLTSIINVKGLDAVIVGPYDLSASIGTPGDFNSSTFIETIDKILNICSGNSYTVGIHVVRNDKHELQKQIDAGFKFIAFSMDTLAIADLKI